APYGCPYADDHKKSDDTTSHGIRNKLPEMSESKNSESESTQNVLYSYQAYVKGRLEAQARILNDIRSCNAKDQSKTAENKTKGSGMGKQAVSLSDYEYRKIRARLNIHPDFDGDDTNVFVPRIDNTISESSA